MTGWPLHAGISGTFASRRRSRVPSREMASSTCWSDRESDPRASPGSHPKLRMRYSKSPIVKGPQGPLSLIKRSASPGAVKHILSYPDRGPRAGGASASSRTSFSPAQKQAAWAYRTTSRSTYMGPISLVGWRHGQCKPYVHQEVWRCQSPFRIPARVDLVWYAGPVSHSSPWYGSFVRLVIRGYV